MSARSQCLAGKPGASLLTTQQEGKPGTGMLLSKSLAHQAQGSQRENNVSERTQWATIGPPHCFLILRSGQKAAHWTLSGPFLAGISWPGEGQLATTLHAGHGAGQHLLAPRPGYLPKDRVGAGSHRLPSSFQVQLYKTHSPAQQLCIHPALAEAWLGPHLLALFCPHCTALCKSLCEQSGY